MPDPANDQLDFEIIRNEEGVWIRHDKWGMILLGQYQPVADAIASWLASEDFGE